MSEIKLVCDLCKKEIEFGAPYVSINYHIENLAHDPLHRRNYVNVVSAEQVATMCGRCGNRANANKVKEVLKLTLSQKSPIHN